MGPEDQITLGVSRGCKSSSYYEIADIGEDSDGGLRQGLNIPEDLLEDYFAERDPGESFWLDIL